jgi:hypothetical protein
MVPKAKERFIKGNVKAKPEMANGPTPCPIKILSIILYKEAAVVPMIAGIEYFRSNDNIDSVSKRFILLLICTQLFLQAKVAKIPKKQFKVKDYFE